VKLLPRRPGQPRADEITGGRSTSELVGKHEEREVVDVANVEQSAAQSAPQAEGLADEGLFIRKSSGLVRELGGREAFALNMGAVNLAGSVGFFFFVILAGFPGVDLTWPIVIALVGAVVLSAIYSQLASAMPRSGADTVYLSRIFHPAVGAAAGIALFSFLIVSLATNATELSNTFIPGVFQTFGEVFHSKGLETFAGDLAKKGATIAVAAVVLVALAALLTRPVGTIARLMFAGFMASFVAIIIIIVEFVTHSHGSFVHAFNASVGKANGYNRLVATGHSAGATPGSHTSEMFSSLALVFGLYVGATFANINGGELRRAARTFRTSTFVSLGVGFALVLGAWLALKGMAGLHFLQSAAYLSTNDPSQYSKLSGGVTAYAPSYLLLVGGDPVTKIVVTLGFTIGEAMIVVSCALASSRVLFALAFDRIVPTKVADVRPKSHVPVVAIAIVAVLGAVLTFLTIETTVLTATRNSYLMVTAVFALSSIAAAVLPWRRRDLYERSPKMLGRNILGIPAVTWIGSFSAIFWIYATYSGATKTQVSGGYSITSVIVLAFMSLGGAACYLVSRYNMRRKGFDLGMAMRELPPE
jgi:basic amino acid/polyamine antiporter, APA family